MADVNLSAEITIRVADAEKNIAALTKTIQDQAARIDALLKKVPKSLNDLTPASKNAAFALTNLGRVASDAPFGFIAIQNNINPLIESFGYLATEAKAAGTSIGSALLGALTGPAGLGLAVAAVTAGLTLYAQSQQKANSEQKKAKETTDDLAEAYTNAANNSAKELSSLTAIYDASQNDNLSRQQRLIAVQKLQKEYPSYFSNFSKEAILAGEATVAYDKLTQSIINRAVVSSSQKLLEDSIKPLIDFYNYQRKNEKQFEQDSKDATDGLYKGLIEKSKALSPALAKELNKIFAPKTKEGILKNISEARGAIQDAIKDLGIESIIDPDSVFKAPKKAKAKRPELGGIFGSQVNNTFGAKDTLTTSLDSQTLAANNAMEAVKAYTESQLDLGYQTRVNNELFTAQNDVLNQTVGIIGGGLTDAFANALAGGQSAFAGIAQLISGLLIKIAAAIAAAALLAALLSFTGLGTFTKSFAGLTSSLSGISGLGKLITGVPALANGGVVSSPTLALIGEGNESEIVAPLSKFDAMVNSRASQNNMSLEPVLIPNGIILQAIKNGENQKGRRGR
jgi:hypothetical protein